jgi:hypothetical protein
MIVFKYGILILLESSGPAIGLYRDYFTFNFIENFIQISRFDTNSVSINNA